VCRLGYIWGTCAEANQDFGLESASYRSSVVDAASTTSPFSPRFRPSQFRHFAWFAAYFPYPPAIR